MTKNKTNKNGAAVTTTKASKSSKAGSCNAANKCAVVASQIQNYTLTSPKGKQYAVNDLNKFAAKHELDASALRRVARVQRLSHREWTAALVG